MFYNVKSFKFTSQYYRIKSFFKLHTYLCLTWLFFEVNKCSLQQTPIFNNGIFPNFIEQKNWGKYHYLKMGICCREHLLNAMFNVSQINFGVYMKTTILSEFTSLTYITYLPELTFASMNMEYEWGRMSV